MKFSYKFSNLCGTVYKCGNICYSSDGNMLYSPVGNRVSVFDLVNHSSYTLPFETRKNIARICVSHNGRFLVAVDVEGKALFANLKRRVALYRFSFQSAAGDVQFSYDDKYIAVAMGKVFQIWYTPSEERHFAPFERLLEVGQHFDDILSIQWSHCGKYVVTASADMNVRIFSVGPIEGFYPVTMSGNRNGVIGAFFSEDDWEIYSVCQDGAVNVWNWEKVDLETWESSLRYEKYVLKKHKIQINRESTEEEEEKREEPLSKYYCGKWKMQKKYIIEDSSRTITTCAYNASTRFLILGLDSGVFSIYEMPTFTNIHSLSISNQHITSCAINPSGDWLAFGCSDLGQLLVWEWQSETYVLKQQGHYHAISTLEFSPDGSIIATGGDDGKVKLWSATSGFCFVTFSEHIAGVTDICYVKGGHALLSASLDGTVRAFDLVRYRNFRVLTTPTPAPFTCVTCDASGDLIAAGSSNPFNIYIWSLRTGKLLDTLTGHEAPISCLQFDSRGTQLASGSWDHTVRVWDLLGSGLKEGLNHPSEVLALDWRKDGEEIATACMNGSAYIWDAKDGIIKGTIDGRRDLAAGRKSTDEFTAKNNAAGKYFRSICYSADGDYLIAAGHSKFVCIYEVKTKTLVRKYALTQNRSLEGVLDMLNSKEMTEAGPQSQLPTKQQEYVEPGVQKGDAGKRSIREEIYCTSVKFSPSGDVFGAATSQGLVLFSLDPSLAFDPFDLTEDVTPDTIRYALAAEEWSKALIYALHLNEENIIRHVLQVTPFAQIESICVEIPRLFLARLLQLLCDQIQKTAYLEYYMVWVLSLLKQHGEYLRMNSRRYLPVLRSIQKCLMEHYSLCKQSSENNMYSLQYLSEVAERSNTV